MVAWDMPRQELGVVTEMLPMETNVEVSTPSAEKTTEPVKLSFDTSIVAVGQFPKPGSAEAQEDWIFQVPMMLPPQVWGAGHDPSESPPPQLVTAARASAARKVRRRKGSADRRSTIAHPVIISRPGQAQKQGPLAGRGRAMLKQFARATTRPDEAPSRRARVALRPLLVGGDRRSLAGSDWVRALVERRPSRTRELAALTGDADWLVALRALDLLEKLARDHAAWVQPHRRVFIGPLADSDQWEIRLQIVRALPLLTWTARERRRVFDILRRDCEHQQTFVRAWALDGLATFAAGYGDLMPLVVQGLEAFERSGRKALAARGRKIRQRLGGL